MQDDEGNSNRHNHSTTATPSGSSIKHQVAATILKFCCSTATAINGASSTVKALKKVQIILKYHTGIKRPFVLNSSSSNNPTIITNL